jgi:hypothetical protein
MIAREYPRERSMCNARSTWQPKVAASTTPNTRSTSMTFSAGYAELAVRSPATITAASGSAAGSPCCRRMRNSRSAASPAVSRNATAASPIAPAPYPAAQAERGAVSSSAHTSRHVDNRAVSVIMSM